VLEGVDERAVRRVVVECSIDTCFLVNVEGMRIT